MANQTIDKDALLRELNDEKARLLVPAMLFIAVLLILGVLGNIMVWFFYGCKTKITPSTSFILTLSIFDLLSCIISMPMEIVDMRFFFNFESNVACKILRFVNHFSSIASGMTLIAIAADRFRRICKPFDKQLSNKHVRIASGFAASLAVLLSWPAMIFNTVMEVDVKNQYSVELKGLDCTTTKEDKYKTYLFVYNMLQFACFILTTIVLAILYFFIGRQLFRHKKFSFYVAKTTSKRVSISPTMNSEFSSYDYLPSSRTLDTLPSANQTCDDQMDAAESVIDLREISTQGMPEVEGIVRPASDSTGIIGPTAITDISGKNRQSAKSIKSVTIYDPKQNQVQDTENEFKAKINASSEAIPGSKTDSILKNTNRPGSANSETTECNQISGSKESDSNDYANQTAHQNATKQSETIPAENIQSDTSFNINMRPKRSGSTGSRANLVLTGGDVTITSQNTMSRPSSATTRNGVVHEMNTDTDNVKDLRMKMLDINTIKYTVIMLVITIIFIVSFLPYLSLIIWRSYSKEHEVNIMTDAQLLWLQIGLRSYFLNSSLNPLIYGFFNSNFRAFFYGLVCGRFKKQHRKSSGRPRSESSSAYETSAPH